MEPPPLNVSSLHHYVTSNPHRFHKASDRDPARLTINLDFPKAAYHPGDVLTGSLHLEIRQVLAIDTVILSFQGRSCVRMVDGSDPPHLHKDLVLFREDVQMPLAPAEKHSPSVKYTFGARKSMSWPFSFQFPLGYDPDKVPRPSSVKNNLNLLHDSRSQAQKNAGVLLDLPSSMRWSDRPPSLAYGGDEAYIQYTLASTLIEDRESRGFLASAYREMVLTVKLLVVIPLPFSIPSLPRYEDSASIGKHPDLTKQYANIELVWPKVAAATTIAPPSRGLWRRIRGQAVGKHEFQLKVYLQKPLRLTTADNLYWLMKLKTCLAIENMISSHSVPADKAVDLNIPPVLIRRRTLNLKANTTYRGSHMIRSGSETSCLLNMTFDGECILPRDKAMDFGRDLSLHTLPRRGTITERVAGGCRDQEYTPKLCA